MKSLLLFFTVLLLGVVVPKNDHTLTVFLYTQAGHDEYIAKYHNEGYFFDLYSDYVRAGSMDSLTGGLDAMSGAIESGDPYNKGALSWTFVKWKNGLRLGNCYLFPAKELQSPSAVAPLEMDILSTCTVWASANKASIIRTTYNPSDEVYFKLVIQLP